MKRAWCLFELVDGGYVILRKDRSGLPERLVIAPSEGESVDDVANRISVGMRELGYRGDPVLFGICHRNALAASVECDRKAVAKNVELLAYALEEYAPHAAEELTCDAIYHGKRALGCMIRTSVYRELFSALRDVGLQIATATPLSVLAWEGLKASHKITGGVVEWSCHDVVHFLGIHDGKPDSWIVASRRSAPCIRETTYAGRDVWKVCDEAPVDGDDVIGMAFELTACEAAYSILSGRSDAAIELLRPPLLEANSVEAWKKPVAFASIFLLCVSVSGFMLSAKFSNHAGEMRKEQVRIFKQVFPSDPVPVGILRRLESKLTVIQQARVDVPRAVMRAHAAETLFHSLACLPYAEEHSEAMPRFHIDTIQVNRDTVRIQGVVRAHTDASTIEGRFRSAGFEVEPQRTESRGGAVTLDLLASTGNPSESQQ